MSVRSFFDTNVFVYAVDAASTGKKRIARALIAESLEKGVAVISNQVVQEFVNVTLTKFKQPLSPEQIRAYMSEVLRACKIVQPSFGLYSDAIDVRARHKLSWYDALIVAAAAEANCALLYTEDLQDGALYSGVRVKNPFPKPT